MLAAVAGAMVMTTVTSLFAESSEAVRRELNVTLLLSFLRNFPSLEAFHKLDGVFDGSTCLA